jgi:hypothetical protein
MIRLTPGGIQCSNASFSLVPKLLDETRVGYDAAARAKLIYLSD